MSTISSTDITINGDTAWLVEIPNGLPPLTEMYGSDERPMDRPCDTCNGDGRISEHLLISWSACSDCGGTGRHTFTIDVPCLCMTLPGCNGPYKGGPCGGTGTRALTVHVVAVLPIESIMGACLNHKGQHVLVGHGLSVLCGGPGTDGVSAVTLPTSAAPGKYAVQLAVHT
jgi:hypothetical protein